MRVYINGKDGEYAGDGRGGNDCAGWWIGCVRWRYRWHTLEVELWLTGIGDDPGKYVF